MVRVVEVFRQLDDGDRERLTAFVERSAAQLGARPLSDHLWLDLRSGNTARSVTVTASAHGEPVAMAQISPGNDAASLEAFVATDDTDDTDDADARTVLDDIAETAIDAFAAAGGGKIYWWVDDPDADDEHFAALHGFRVERGLHEMRRQLPHELHATVDTRSFVPGVDDDAWLEVNNRAFADHGEQGGWTSDTLQQRIAEPWFDPAGFRLLDVDGRLAAFCWTKLHHDHDPVLGEIYVIAVDPDFFGRGLGKQLTLAGLDSISARGVTTANLYVDVANDAAVGLYERLGFTIHRTRRAYVADVPPSHQEQR